MDIVIEAKTTHLNLSPELFRQSAFDYFRCFLKCDADEFLTPVPFFLCCRAIELAIKAQHLYSLDRLQIKARYSHDLVKAYNKLDPTFKTLDDAEYELLSFANEIYVQKDFEYFSEIDAATCSQRFPNLKQLARLAKKITGCPT